MARRQGIPCPPSKEGKRGHYVAGTEGQCIASQERPLCRGLDPSCLPHAAVWHMPGSIVEDKATAHVYTDTGYLHSVRRCTETHQLYTQCSSSTAGGKSVAAQTACHIAGVGGLSSLLPDVVLVEFALEQLHIPCHPLLEGSYIRPTLQVMSPVHHVFWGVRGGGRRWHYRRAAALWAHAPHSKSQALQNLNLVWG